MTEFLHSRRNLHFKINCFRVVFMSTVQEIEEAVSRLSLEELATFREWFSQLDADAWDRQLQRDITAGRLRAYP